MQIAQPHLQRRQPQHGASILLEQISLALLLALLLSALAAFLTLGGYQIVHMGVIYRGVSVNGTDLSGLTVQEATEAILANTTFSQTGNILFTDGERQWLATPAELGLFLDAEGTARLAFEVGRSGSLAERLWAQYRSLAAGVDFEPNYILDQSLAYQYINSIAAQVYVPVTEPSLQISGTDVIVNPGIKGRQVDTGSTLTLATLQLNLLHDGVIPLVITEQSPQVVDPSEQAELARRILSEPLTLSLPADAGVELGPWTFERLALAAMLSFEFVESEEQSAYQVTLNSQTIYNFLLSLEPELYRKAVNARFMFNDDTRLIEVTEPSVQGRALDVEASIQAIHQKLIDGEHAVSLVVNYTDPPVPDTMTGAELGITELVHAETSYYYGSSSERVQNISAAASRFHGLLVAPGETFSMAEALGDISLENGYAEALIIYGGQTIQGIGGGVCQVSTTLFRTVFFGGFPIVERHSHAYRVSYYEKVAGNKRDNSLAGLDATVYVPVVDFKFTNDTPYWLLMETYVNPSYSSLIWKFYSTSDGRSVEWQTSGVTNVVEAPEPLYRENPDLPQGEVKQVDWEADGADVSVQRWVYRDGQVIIEDTIKTHYEPWQAIYEYGPGTEGMPPEDAETPEP